MAIRHIEILPARQIRGLLQVHYPRPGEMQGAEKGGLWEPTQGICINRCPDPPAGGTATVHPACARDPLRLRSLAYRGHAVFPR